jgi:predicted RNA binding protein YcfA (HicA-like mRNA interferase family)
MKSVSARDFVKVLHKKGWRIVRIKGSHHVLKHPSFKDSVSVPVHGNIDLKTGMLKKLMKITGVDETEL